jgi:hypothetical protein
VKIATFAKRQTVKLSKNPLTDSILRVGKPVVNRISETGYFKKCKIPSVKGRKISHKSLKVLSLSSPQKGLCAESHCWAIPVLQVALFFPTMNLILQVREFSWICAIFEVYSF